MKLYKDSVEDKIKENVAIGGQEWDSVTRAEFSSNPAVQKGTCTCKLTCNININLYTKKKTKQKQANDFQCYGVYSTQEGVDDATF